VTTDFTAVAVPIGVGLVLLAAFLRDAGIRFGFVLPLILAGLTFIVAWFIHAFYNGSNDA
jgi:hypothetical protein